MKKLPLLNLFRDMAPQRGTPLPRKFSLDAGRGLFAAFLMKNQKELFHATEIVSKSDLNKKGIKVKDIDQLLEEISRVLGEIKVGEQLASKLFMVLGGQHTNRDAVIELVKQASDKEGRVDLMRLFGQAIEAGLIQKAKGPKTMVSTPQVPSLAKLLFDVGFKVEDVKRILETSKAENGLKTSKVLPYLEKLSPGLSQEKIIEWLARYGIEPHMDCQDHQDHIVANPQIKKGLRASAVNNDELKHVAKLKLAEALKEKGLAPNEVKEILEKVSLKELKSQALIPNDSPKSVRRILEDLIREISANYSHKNHKSQQSAVKAVAQDLHNKLQSRVNHKSGPEVQVFPEIKDWLQEAKNEVRGREVQLKGHEMPHKNCPSVGRYIDGREVQLKGHEMPLPIFRDKPGGMALDLANPPSMDSNKVMDIQETISKIRDYLRVMLRRGEQEALIKLSPPDLGELNLKVEMKDGYIHARIGTEYPWIKEAIEGSIAQLRHHLEEMGFMVAKLEVRVGWSNREQRGGTAFTWERSRKNRTKSQGPISSPTGAGMREDRLVHVVA